MSVGRAPMGLTDPKNGVASRPHPSVRKLYAIPVNLDSLGPGGFDSEIRFPILAHPRLEVLGTAYHFVLTATAILENTSHVLVLVVVLVVASDRCIRVKLDVNGGVCLPTVCLPMDAHCGALTRCSLTRSPNTWLGRDAFIVTQLVTKLTRTAWCHRVKGSGRIMRNKGRIRNKIDYKVMTYVSDNCCQI